MKRLLVDDSFVDAINSLPIDVATDLVNRVIEIEDVNDLYEEDFINILEDL